MEVRSSETLDSVFIDAKKKKKKKNEAAATRGERQVWGKVSYVWSHSR